ncbi:tyrosinase family protein [Desmonostoc muscorum CCALA 125]|uniref:Tyrosinase family protein n=1 Tax=Desmonostoc muscorum LEGE 12446 TaxID=1828758 RepID=A0A8J7DI34_DESMC|nr:tyrosinase family protein [Desmonostoc muscorum]MBX9258343.1 tyrosinase family protein [Desmonostoc muscorum CCALA 125]MCF2148618.1 tyrosinase family protein [Desmonostoc muscorum LEGE 12446]
MKSKIDTFVRTNTRKVQKWRQNFQQRKKSLKFFRQTIIMLCVGIILAMTMVKTPAMDVTLVRKNVVDLTPQEKADFVNAIKTLKRTIPKGSNISLYDQIVAIHVGAMGFSSMHMGGMNANYSNTILHPTGPAAGTDAAHANAGFLPWHREYLRRFEKALQSVNPKITIPYWDWKDPRAIDIIFKPDFLGANGTGTTINVPGAGSYLGGSVQFGNFSLADGWVLNNNLHIDQITNQTLGTSLIRFLKIPPANNYPLPQTEINNLLNINDYLQFRAAIEGDISVDQNGNETPGVFTHNYLHGLVGGVLVDLTQFPPPLLQRLGTMSNVPGSPNDPIFWLHHANVDRLWAQWQENHRLKKASYPKANQPYGHNLNDPMWPWDGGQSTPGKIGPGDIRSLLPNFARNDIVTPKDTLNLRNYGYTYDTLKHVPEVPIWSLDWVHWLIENKF